MSSSRYIVRTIIGVAILAFAITCVLYGLSQTIEIGSCGTDKYGRSVGPACPSGTAAMIISMVFGTFLGIFGGGVLASRGRPDGSGGPGLGMGIAVGQGFFWVFALIGAAVAVTLAIVDIHPHDSRPGIEVVAAAAGPIVLGMLASLAFGQRSRGPSYAPGFAGARPAVRRGMNTQPPPAPWMSGDPVPKANPSLAPEPPAFLQPDPPAGPFAGSAYTPPQPAGFNQPPPRPATAAPSSSSGEDPLAQIKRLNDMRASGALSQAEFEAAKARLLGEL